MVNGFKTRLLLVIFFAYSLISLSGCATVPAQRTAFGVEPFYVKDVAYYPLLSACQYLNIYWEYDSLGRQITLKKADTEVKALIDSSVILVNGYPQDIGQSVIVHNGIVSIPIKFKEKVLDKFYCPIIPREKPLYTGPVNIRRVVIDAGHGGHDPGAIGRSGLREKDINLDIAKRLGKALKACGIDVVFTRSTDRFISLEGRAEIANRAHPDMFISVHTNAARSRSLSGFEIYYVTDKVNDSARAALAAKKYDLSLGRDSFYRSSPKLEAIIWDMLNTQYRGDSIVLAQDICESISRTVGSKILGVKGAPFYVLKGVYTPAVLVEIGFISNSQEERYLRNGFYRQQIAEGIAQGIFEYGRRYDLAGS